MRIAISPCPNDTFIHEELAREELAAGGQLQFLDIAELNALADHPDGPDLVKVSCAAAPRFLERYAILPAGGAFSQAVGPLAVRSGTLGAAPRSVGLPGPGTTAHLLWRLWIASRGEMPLQESFHRFDLLPDLCVRGVVDLAVVIHESRFTFQDAGLQEVQDLGAFWDRSTGLPVPLGCLLVRRDRGRAFARAALERVRASLESAWSRLEPTTPWIGAHAQEMSADVQRQHIATYVNRRSLDCGEEGLAAMERLWQVADDHMGGCGASARTRRDALDEARTFLLRD
jgi:1,4-dihydroxy-6-naphthoate synthase